MQDKPYVSVEGFGNIKRVVKIRDTRGVPLCTKQHGQSRVFARGRKGGKVAGSLARNGAAHTVNVTVEGFGIRKRPTQSRDARGVPICTNTSKASMGCTREKQQGWQNLDNQVWKW